MVGMLVSFSTQKASCYSEFFSTWPEKGEEEKGQNLPKT